MVDCVLRRTRQFRASHENVEGETWRRTGEVTAWQVVAETVIDTLEGPATARIGDWVVTAPDGSSWPVPNEAFRAGYEQIQ